MQVSIVLCSYNGEKYIAEQLESLRNQQRPADEVLIVDDKSSDQTVHIIRNYINKHELNHWKLIINEQNKGWKKNFMDALEKAQGDIIFPCDQDDIWEADKIAKMERIMEKNKQIQVLASNYDTLYEGQEYRKVSNVFLKGTASNGQCRQLTAADIGLHVLRPGCAMAVRKELLELSYRYMFDNYPHDALLWRVALFTDSLYLYDYPTIQFRRHDSNASDAKNHQQDSKLEQINYYLAVIVQLRKLCTDRGDDLKLDLLASQKRFWKTRLNFYKTGSLRVWIKLFFCYRKYYLTLKSVLGDLYIVKVKK